MKNILLIFILLCNSISCATNKKNNTNIENYDLKYCKDYNFELRTFNSYLYKKREELKNSLLEKEKELKKYEYIERVLNIKTNRLDSCKKYLLNLKIRNAKCDNQLRYLNKL